jgi:Ca2+-binding RTX toxin-like protein
LVPATVAENAANATVGTLSTTDVDAGDSFTYSIQPGGNGAAFVIAGNELKVGAAGLDYEAGATQSVTVRTTDAAGAFFDKTFTVNVTNVNETPTNIALSANAVAENAANATVGTLSTTDPDAGDTFTYSIRPGGDGAQFTISGNQLKVGATALDYEAGATRSVTVRTTDSGGAFFDKTLTINVTNVNDAPTNAALSSNTVAENAPNVTVGTLSTADQDAGDTFTYSIRPGGDGAQFAIVGNELRVGTTALDYEAGATRSVTVRTTDAAGAFFDKTLTVNVTNVNEAPTNIALVPATVAENAANATVGTLSTTDVDAGDSFTYSIQPGGNGAAFVIAGNELKVGAAGLDYEAGATQSVTVRTTDAAGAFFDKTFTVNVSNVNETPTNVALSANTVAENAANATVGTFSTTDVDAGDTFTYSIQPGGDGAQFVVSGNQLKVGAAALDYEAGATRNVTVRTTDAAGAFFDRSFTINVTNVNETPTNIALSANTVAENAANAAVGTLSTSDPDAGDSFTYSIRPGGDGAQFVIVSNELRVGATALDYEAGATRNVTVRTTDAAGAFFDKVLTVNVTNVNEAPTNIGLSPSTIAENAPNATVGTLSTTDVDAGDTFSYSIQPGGDGAQFVISGNQLKVGAAGLDYEAGATRNVTVRTTDGSGAFFNKTFTVNVSNVNEAPTDLALSANTVTENAANATVGTLSTSDVDAGDTFTYSIQPGGNGSQFVISGNQLKVGATGLDYEAGATRSVTVRTTDAAGAFFDKTLTVNVSNVNETPTNVALSANTVAENAANVVVGNLSTTDVDAGDTFTYSIQPGGDGAQFVISGTQLKVGASGLDFEASASRSVTVRTTDAAGAFFDKVLTINVTNVNEAPTNIGLSPSTIAENAPNATVGTLSTTDVDAGDTFTYAIQPVGDGAQFVISGNQLKVGAAGLDYEAGATRSVTVRTTDAAGAFFDKTFTVNVSNVNETPTNIALSANTVAENAPNVTVGTLSTTDQDAGDAFTYSIQPGGNGAQFVISGNQLRVGATGLDYESGSPRSVTVRTTDAAGAFFDKTLTVNVTNVNEAPTVANAIPDQNAFENQSYSFTVAVNAFVDLDAGDTLTYTATRPDGSALPAWLSFNAATRTFSGTPSAADNGTISVKVSASDGGGLSTFDVFDLAVTPSVINGTAGNDNLVGSAFNDTINGLGGNDTLSGLAGNDLLDGGAGVDAMAGGTGNDTYVVDNAGDTVTRKRTRARISCRARPPPHASANVENLTLTGGGNINGTGNASDNTLTGNTGNNMLSGAAGADTLDGGAGADSLWGGAGNDSYVVDNAGDVVTEALTTTTTYQWQNQYYWKRLAARVELGAGGDRLEHARARGRGGAGVLGEHDLHLCH